MCRQIYAWDVRLGWIGVYKHSLALGNAERFPSPNLKPYAQHVYLLNNRYTLSRGKVGKTSDTNRESPRSRKEFGAAFGHRSSVAYTQYFYKSHRET